MDSFGFIITRHVNSENTNKYWNHCVKCLRTFYPEKKIVIIEFMIVFFSIKGLCSKSF